MKHALILVNGKAPGKRLFRKILASAEWFICADGGANTAARFGCIPDLIVGDLDSIKNETLVLFKHVDVKKLKDQNSTDLEKALTAAIRKKCKEIVVLGATGGRLDHAIGNLSALAKFSRHAHLTYVDEGGTYLAINRSIELTLPTGTIISLIPLSRCSGIVTTGLQWNLNNESLELGVRESTSNVVVSSPVSVRVKQGSLIAFVMTHTSTLISHTL
jgi:thiamine pyrophosphokinase